MARERSIVLAGSGHAHLHVALHSDAFRQRGARVVLIDPDAFWYSGLATGMLGGAYSAADDQLSPGDIIRANGAHFIQDWVASVEPKKRRVHLGGGDSVRYDYLSLNVGSGVDLTQIAGASKSETTFVLGDSVMATAILDRLLHHATTVNIKGESYRLKEKRKAGLLGQARPTTTQPEEETATETAEPDPIN